MTNKSYNIVNLNKQMQIQDTWVAPRQPVWLHKNQQFVKAVIKQIFKEIITVTLQSGDSVKCKRADIYHRNPLPIEVSRTDLMENDIINQPEILQHLSARFLNRKIYTYVENTLIAVNPYFLIPELYTDQLKDQYITNIIQSPDTGLSSFKEQDPHLYAITAQMVKALFVENCSQAVIISGESGAGKTEVNKECLRFLAHYFKSINKAGHQKESNIEHAIMLSNPILQAFGNAKTIRNNNSSRFGKYLSIMIDSKTRQIKHAEIYNYLLEKSRIISRSQDQQNFHIFYELLTKTTMAQKQKYKLLNPETNKQLTFQNFAYTENKQQSQYLAHPDISLDKIKESLTILPDPRSFDYLCRILSAVLHLGNLSPYEDENLDYCEIMEEESVDIVCSLLEIQKKYFLESLTSYSIKIGGEDMVKSFSKRQVQQLIHSLSKTLYQRLFQWIINEINSSTRSKDHQTSNLLALGFLDIYGFEVLKVNSLQQLFINYTNERLHQLYLQKIFKLEKEYFVSQKLQHKFRQVNFEDNVKVIELIDYQKLSIFNLLDEQCAIASPDQTTFITKIRFNHKKHEKFPSSNLNLLSTQFIIRHTPQDVQYSVQGFRDKNRDLLREEIKITMRSSKLKILQTMFTEPKLEADMDSKAHKVRKFLSSKFRKEMNQLMNGLLSKSQQLFIRCIKSNGSKKPLEIEQEIVYSQIKYLGILDTIKIKKMGYCIKIKYEEMDRRFKWAIRPSYMVPASPKEIAEQVKLFVPKLGEEDILFGLTKLFFKDYAFAVFLRKYGLHMLILNLKAHKITSFFVRINYQSKKRRKDNHKKTVIKYVRGFLEAKKLRKRIKNVVKVQKSILNFLSFRSRAKKLESVQILQAYIKRNIESKQRNRRINMLEKVVCKLKFLMLKKKVRSRLVVDYIINKVLLSNFWGKLRQKNLQVLSKYINAYKIRIQKREYINLAIRNQRNAIQGRSLQNIEKYIIGFANIIRLTKRKRNITKIQSNIKTFLERKRFNKVRSQVMLIQKAIRQYLFLKKGAKDLFQKAYSSYQQNLRFQNKNMETKLYGTLQSHPTGINASVRKFLGKFKDKISLLYFVIDFQSFVDLQIIYPKQSWALNFLQVFEEGLEKNDPVQYLSVGETFTVVANTTKMYLWGMHQSFKNIQEDSICIVKTKMPVQFFEINKNKLNYSYVRDDENEKKNQLKSFKICSTVSKDYNLENGKIYECLPNELRLIKEIPSTQRVLQISCGKAHLIFRSSAKKVYTQGIGREGQLGHSSFNSEEKPRSIKFFQNIKTFSVIQVSASFTSSMVLLSNRKMYWFGKNATLNEVSTPSLFELKSKFEILAGNEFSIARILSSWSRTMSVTGLTIICYNKKFQNNLALRSKTTQILFTKWQEAGINNINPPVITSVSDHLEQCHVKLRSKKINIYPESKATLKEMQEKVKSISSLAQGGLDTGTHRNSVGTQFSFANTQRNSFYK